MLSVNVYLWKDIEHIKHKTATKMATNIVYIYNNLTNWVEVDGVSNLHKHASGNSPLVEVARMVFERSDVSPQLTLHRKQDPVQLISCLVPLDISNVACNICLPVGTQMRSKSRSN